MFLTPLAVIFDLDGTLVDTETLALYTWESVIARYGGRYTAEHHRQLVGTSVAESLRRVFDWFELPLTPDAFLAQLDHAWEANLARGVRPMPGLQPLLAELDRRAVPWGVATNGGRRYAELILRQLGVWDACRALVSYEDVARPKPAPDVYLACARLLGVPPARCLAVEDSVTGHQAAAAAGMQVAVVPGHWTQADPFALARHRFPSLTAVTAALPDLLGPAPEG